MIHRIGVWDLQPNIAEPFRARGIERSFGLERSFMRKFHVALGVSDVEASPPGVMCLEFSGSA